MVFHDRNVPQFIYSFYANGIWGCFWLFQIVLLRTVYTYLSLGAHVQTLLSRTFLQVELLGHSVCIH